MASVLFQHQNQKNNSILDLVNQAKAMGPSAIVAQQLYNSNPKFRQLADSVQGMTPEQACAKYGADFNQFRPFKW